MKVHFLMKDDENSWEQSSEEEKINKMIMFRLNAVSIGHLVIGMAFIIIIRG